MPFPPPGCPPGFPPPQFKASQYLGQAQPTGFPTIVQGNGGGVGGRGGEEEAHVLARSEDVWEENVGLEVSVVQLRARHNHLLAVKARLQALNPLTLGPMAPAPSAPLEGTQLEVGDEVALHEEVGLEEEVVEQMVGEFPMEQAAMEAPLHIV